jgi:hypothetical protein
MTVAVCFVFGVMVTKVSGKDIISQDKAVLEQRALHKRMPRVGNLNPLYAHILTHSHWQSVVGKDAVICEVVTSIQQGEARDYIGVVRTRISRELIGHNVHVN